MIRRARIGDATARQAFRTVSAALPLMFRFALIGLWAIPFSAHANLFVGDTETGPLTVAAYTTSGAVVNGSLITGLQAAFQFGFLGDLALSGESLFVASWGTNNGLSYQDTVGKYTLSGLAVNPTLITNNGIATALAVSNSQIFVRTSPDNMETTAIDTIGEYTISGALVNPALITGLTDPVGIVVSGNDLYVAEANFRNGIVGKYTTLGEPIDPTLVTDLGFPAITLTGSPSSVPEPRATVWLTLALASLLVTDSPTPA